MKKESGFLLRIRIYDAVKRFREEKASFSFLDESDSDSDEPLSLQPQHTNPYRFLAELYQDHPFFASSKKSYGDNTSKLIKYIREKFRQYAEGRREDIYKLKLVCESTNRDDKSRSAVFLRLKKDKDTIRKNHKIIVTRFDKRKNKNRFYRSVLDPLWEKLSRCHMKNLD